MITALRHDWMRLSEKLVKQKVETTTDEKK